METWGIIVPLFIICCVVAVGGIADAMEGLVLGVIGIYKAIKSNRQRTRLEKAPKSENEI